MTPKMTIFKFWKVTGPNWGSKFIFLRKEPTHLLGFVIIRLGARATKKNSGTWGNLDQPIGGPLTSAL